LPRGRGDHTASLITAVSDDKLALAATSLSDHCARRDLPMHRNPPSLPMLSMLLLLPMLRIDAKLPMLRSDAALATDSTLEALSTLHKLL
jgi:hypothetical protein